MDREVYESALNWNGISSNAHVSVVMETPGMPTISGAMNVYDSKGELPEHKLDVTRYYDSNGDRILDYSRECSYVIILINTKAPIFNEISNPVEAAGMNFTHEVGHALALAHPERDAPYHDIDGYPYAVINTGLPIPGYPQVSPRPTYHDENCLLYKWGN